MLTKTVKYTDYNGIERTETLYFNLTKSELVEMEATTSGGMLNKLERLSGDPNGLEIMKIFKDIILKSYGVKSDDGKSFVKSPEQSEAFSQTIAYDTLFMKMVTNPEAAAEFVNAVIPDFDIDTNEAALKPVE